MQLKFLTFRDECVNSGIFSWRFTMSTAMAWIENRNRTRAIIFTCWAVWLIAIPIMVLAAARTLGVEGFWDAPWANWELPGLAILPLFLFTMSSIGLWRMRIWGLVVYGIAGLLLVSIMILQSEVPTIPGFESVSGVMGWSIIAALHVVYTSRLWKEL